MSTYSPYNLNPSTDRDALWVLLLSLLVMGMTFGLCYIFLLILVIAKAQKTLVRKPTKSAVFLVFGKKLLDNRPDTEFRERLDRLSSFHFQSAIIMGGITGTTNISEAQAGLDYLREHGCHRQNIRLEQSSRNTLENLKNTRQLLHRQAVIIISNRYHLARCSALASSLKITHTVCAAEQRFKLTANVVYKILCEAFYLHWFYTGKYWARLINNQRMLNKIS